MTFPNTAEGNEGPHRSAPKPTKPEQPTPPPEQDAQEREKTKLKSPRKPRTQVIIAPSTDPGPDVQISTR